MESTSFVSASSRVLRWQTEAGSVICPAVRCDQVVTEKSEIYRLFELRRVFVNPSLNSSSCRLKHLAPPTHRRLPKFLLLFHYSFLSPVLWQRTPDWRCRQEPCRHKHVRLFVSPCSHLILIFEYIVSPSKTSYCSQVRRWWSSIGFLRSSER